MLGGAGPNNSRLNLDQIHGVGQEAHVDFHQAAPQDEEAAYMRRAVPELNKGFDPSQRAEAVHGEETVGLGTSTFLEGAPAARVVLQRRESELEDFQVNGGLSRKKSLAQRFKSVRTAGRANATSPEPAPTPTSPLGTTQSESNAPNPFFKDYDKETRKGQGVTLTDEQPSYPRPMVVGRARAPSSPKRAGGLVGLERKVTQENVGSGAVAADDGAKEGGKLGLLGRVKSLKRGAKPRVGEKRDPS